MKGLLYGVIIFAGVLSAGCSKVGGSIEDQDLNTIDINDDVFPVITISKPTVNQVYKSGYSIIVEGKVADDKKLYKGKVLIRNDINNFILAEAYYETHFLAAIDYRLAYKAEVTSSTDFSVLLEFQDHGLNTSTAIIKVKVNT